MRAGQPPRNIFPLLVRLDEERGQADNTGTARFGGSQHDELRVSVLCEKFWNAQPARVKAKALRSTRRMVRARGCGGSLPRTSGRGR